MKNEVQGAIDGDGDALQGLRADHLNMFRRPPSVTRCIALPSPNRTASASARSSARTKKSQDSTTNEPEYRRLQINELMETLCDRTVKIDVPYVTRLSDEIKVRKDDFRREITNHIAALAIETNVPITRRTSA